MIRSTTRSMDASLIDRSNKILVAVLTWTSTNWPRPDASLQLDQACWRDQAIAELFIRVLWIEIDQSGSSR